MPVYYDSKKIIPAPFVGISKEYQFAEDGTKIGSTFTLTVKGTLIPYKGSPNSTGAFWDQSGYPPDESLSHDEMLRSLLTKQAAIRKLFAVNGKSFEIQPLDGSAPTKCNPVVRRIEFAEAQWFNRTDYTVVLEASVLYLDGAIVEEAEFDEYISKVTKDWQFETLDETKKTYRLTHNVMAAGKTFYDEDGELSTPAWQRAKNYVLNTLGLGVPSGSLTNTVLANWTGTSETFKAYNYLRTQQQNEMAGTFQVTETWICYDAQGGPPAIDECTITKRTSATEAGRVFVSIDGTVTGLEERDPTSGGLISVRYPNAAAKWAIIKETLLSRAETAAGETLNPIAITTSVGGNQVAGTVTYHYEFDNRPSSDIPGAISQLVTVSNAFPKDVFASIPVLGNPLGPVLQSIGTITERRRTINIEVQMKPKSMSFTPSKPDTDSIILARKPAANPVFVDGNDDSFVEETGKFNRTVMYVWVE